MTQQQGMLAEPSAACTGDTSQALLWHPDDQHIIYAAGVLIIILRVEDAPVAPQQRILQVLKAVDIAASARVSHGVVKLACPT